MTLHRIHWIILGLAGSLTTTTIGCTRWIEILPSSPSHQESISRSIPNDERVPLVMDTFRLSQNGAPQNPSSEMERRILNAVQETHLFSTFVPLGGHSVSLGDKVVTARVAFDETIDPHPGQSAWKGFVVGASMFLLSPIIELDYDYSAKATLELERWDGQVTRYEARSSGTVHYNLFGASPIMITELKGQVTEACLAELMDQLVRDTTLYMAGSAPLADSAVRTVTVTGRTHTATPPPLSIVPITVSPSP